MWLFYNDMCIVLRSSFYVGFRSVNRMDEHGFGCLICLAKKVLCFDKIVLETIA